MIQTTKDKMWTDESGNTIPVGRITKFERLAERNAAQLLNDAKRIAKSLQLYKSKLETMCDEVFDEFMKSKAIDTKKGKGNFTWFNFDRSIKIEVSVSDRISFDDLTLSACREKLNEFTSSKIDDEFIREIVNDAFSSSKGKLDAKKVMNLLKYRSRANNKLYDEAMTLLEQSIRRPGSNIYYRIYEKDAAQNYVNINLNFSSI